MHMYNFLCSDYLLYFFLFLSTLHSVYTRDCSCELFMLSLSLSVYQVRLDWLSLPVYQVRLDWLSLPVYQVRLDWLSLPVYQVRLTG